MKQVTLVLSPNLVSFSAFGMGICWGSPDLPSPTFIRRFHDLKVSSSEDTTPVFRDSCGAEANQDRAGDAPEVWNSSSSRNPKVFNLAELTAATRNFGYRLGESRSDVKYRVYIGWLGEGRGLILVKSMEFKKKPSSFHCSIMLRKIEHLCHNQSHPNLAQVLGYCLTEEKLHLVYDYQEISSTLEDQLFKGPSDMVENRKAALAHLSWGRRIQIATETARALAHLHKMDLMAMQYFQASFILLDKSYRVKIAAFSFLDSELVTSPRRTGRKYAEIMYNKEAENQRKQDIYDFGVILIEILTGLALGRNQRSGDYGLHVDWIKQRLWKRDSLAVLMDSCIDSYSLDVAFQVAQLALLCLDPDPEHRPQMYQVKETLEGINVLQDACERRADVMS